MAPKLGQEFVRSLRADGMSEVAVREQLKAMGYKAGRVSQLLAATAASGSRDVPATMDDAEAGRKLAGAGFACAQKSFLAPYCATIRKPCVLFRPECLTGRLGEQHGGSRGWNGHVSNS